MSIESNSPKETTQDATPSKPNDKEYNFAQLRKKQEQTEYELIKEREERARLSEQVEALKSQKPQANSDDDDDSSEPYVDHKKLKKEIRKLKEENETIITKKAEEIANRMFEQERKNNEGYRLKTMYPDFNEVLTEQNAQKLSERYPELADKILKVSDEQLRKEMAYQTIKSMNLHKPDPTPTNTQEQINQRQRSVFYHPSGIASPPAVNSSDFSDVGKKQAWEKMQSLIKNRRG